MTGHPALAEASATPAWLDSPLRPAARPALPADTTADLVVVGGGYTGLWTAVLAKERDPSRDVVLLEAQRIGWAASGRNGGFCAASLTHGEGQRRAAVPRRDQHARAARPPEPHRDRVGHRPLRHRLRLRADRRALRGHRAPPGDLAPGGGSGRRGRLPRPGSRPRRGRLADVPRRALGARHQRPRRPGPAGVGAGRRGGAARRTHPRGHRRDGPRARRAGDGRSHGVRSRRAGTAGRAGHQRVPLARAAAALAHRAGLRLRPDDRAALGRAAGLGRLAQPAGHRRLRQPVPLLPADRRQPDPVGRLRRDLPLRAADRGRPRPAAGHLRAAGAAVLRDVPAAGGTAVHPPVGRGDRHLHPVLRLLRHGVRRPGGVRRWATPGSASGPPGSAPT